MKVIEKLVLMFALVLVFGVSAAFSQGAVRRDPADRCNDPRVFNPVTGNFEGGHQSTTNWFTQDGTGYLAFVSREDFFVPQYLWDCSNDIVGGSIIENTSHEGITKVHMVLDYDLPLEVWTMNNFRRVARILDHGRIRMKVVQEADLPYPGAPLRGFINHAFRVTGIGYAYGTGEGEFEPGQMVQVKVTQIGMYLPQTPENSAVGRDYWPVENIQLFPLEQ